MTDLQIETATFERDRAELLRTHAGRFVVYVGDQRLGVFDDEESAARAAIVDHRKERFLLRQVRAVDPEYCVPSLVRVR